MTTGPSQEYVKAQLESADEALSDAQYLLEGRRLKAAANRAYYAMFYAVQAALAAADVDRPRTHSGAVSLFGLHYIRIYTRFSSSHRSIAARAFPSNILRTKPKGTSIT